MLNFPNLIRCRGSTIGDLESQLIPTGTSKRMAVDSTHPLTHFEAVNGELPEFYKRILNGSPLKVYVPFAKQYGDLVMLAKQKPDDEKLQAALNGLIREQHATATYIFFIPKSDKAIVFDDFRDNSILERNGGFLVPNQMFLDNLINQASQNTYESNSSRVYFPEGYPWVRVIEGLDFPREFYTGDTVHPVDLAVFRRPEIAVAVEEFEARHNKSGFKRVIIPSKQYIEGYNSGVFVIAVGGTGKDFTIGAVNPYTALRVKGLFL